MSACRFSIVDSASFGAVPALGLALVIAFGATAIGQGHLLWK